MNTVTSKVLIAISIGAFSALPALSQQTPPDGFDIPTTALVPQDMGDHADAAGIDLAGTWEYATGNHTVSGRPCEIIGPGSAFSGLLEITQVGDAIAMSFVSGATCNPESMCHYTGQIADGYLVVFNHDTVDDEGGTVTNTHQFTFLDANQGMGTGGSLYVHPDGQCTWNYDFVFHRPGFVDGEWTPGAAQAND